MATTAKSTRVLILALAVGFTAAGATGMAQLPDRAAVTAAMLSASKHYIANDPHVNCGWEWATLYEGIMQAHSATAEETFLDQAQAWAQKYNWTVCNYPKTIDEKAAANDYLIGSVCSQIYKATGHAEEKYVANTHAFLDAEVARSSVDDYWWIDAFFMGLPIFTDMYNVTHDDRYLDKQFALFNDTTVARGMWSTNDSLYWRDQTYIHQHCPNGQGVFWARGNGWAFAGFARILSVLPQSHRHYSAYKTKFLAMASKLKAIQGDDGFWRASLLDANQCPNPESTGTGMFVFGMAWGVSSGILDRSEYESVALKGWNGLLSTAYHPDGLVGWCQPAGGGPKNTTATATSSFCVGQFLLAGSAVLGLQQ